MQECLFCNMSQGKIKTDFIYSDEKILAINDIEPKAPHHILIIPHQHIATLNDITEENNKLIGHMIQTAKNLAKKFQFHDKGYRLVFNCNSDGGQAIFHIHLHVLGGRKLSWPPG